MKPSHKLFTSSTLLIFAFANSLAFASPDEQSNDASKSSLRFVIQGNTVYDKNTNLTWQRCSVGQHWKENTGCEGSIKVLNFDQAQQQASDGWRVPTKDELGSLIDGKIREPNQSTGKEEVVFPDLEDAKIPYWSSPIDGVAYGWQFEFEDGYVFGYRYDRTDTLAVKLVKSEK